MKKRLIIIASLVGLLGIGLISQQIYQSVKYPAVINIEVAPSDAKIKINGQAARSGKVRVKPGSYTVAASRAGFADYSVRATAAKNKPGYAGLILYSNSAATADWYQTHPKDRKLVEAISSKNFDAASSAQVKSEPFILKLPFIAPGDEFKIDYGPPNSQSGGRPVIYIRAGSEEAQNDSKTWIRAQGFDPDKLYIVFTGS